MSLVGIKQLVALTRMHNTTISAKLKELVPQKGPRNSLLYESADALPAIYVGKAGTLDLNSERARLAKAQANVTEMQEAELRGVLVRADEAIAHYQHLVSTARSRLLAMPVKLASMVIGETDLGTIEATIRDEIEAALHELAGDGPAERARARFERDPQDVAPAAPPEDERMGGSVSQAVVGDIG